MSYYLEQEEEDEVEEDAQEDALEQELWDRPKGVLVVWYI